MSNSRDFLNYYWGYEDFRSPQKEIIETIIESTDVVALLPTGAGKSICYQIPAVMLKGICIVISPLLALIKDQVQQLKKRNISAEYISSDQTNEQQNNVFNKLIYNEIKLLYVSPERLLNNAFLNLIKDVHISFIAVDEAHCISEWGNDFRPSYRKIKEFREYIGMEIPCMALTATATEKVLGEIVSKLDLRNAQVFKKSYERENISLNIIKTDNKIGQIERILTKYKGSGIIYCRTRKETKYICDLLKNKGFDVDYYHAGIPLKDKMKKQSEWTFSNSKVLISTNAFGMGIDKENVRTIIHLSPAYSLENYYQEVGRAGRDGLLSYAFLFWNESELSEIETILLNSIPSKSEYEKIIKYLYSYYEIAPNELPLINFNLNFSDFHKKVKIHKNKIITILEYLTNSGIVNWNYENTDSLLKFNFPPDKLDDNAFGMDTDILELISRNVNGIFTHEVKIDVKKFSEVFFISYDNLVNILNKYSSFGNIEFLNGEEQKIRFLTPRNDALIFGNFWKYFKQIQDNKMLKFKELEYFIKNTKYCRMRLILGYFGEKIKHNCNKCDICVGNKNFDIFNDLYNFIFQSPRKKEEIYSEFFDYSFEKIHETLQELISEEKIKLINYNTYSI